MKMEDILIMNGSEANPAVVDVNCCNGLSS